MKKEKQELINTNIQNNDIKPKKRKNNSIFSNNKVYLTSFYFFLLKTYFKEYFIWIIFLMFLCPIILSLVFCYVSLNSELTTHYYFFGVGLVFIINSFIFSSLICLKFLGYLRFTDWQTRIALLNIKKSGYVFLKILSVLTYILIADLLTLITVTSFMLIYNISFFSVFNWPLIFFFIYSILIAITLSSLYLLIIGIFKSSKNCLLFSEVFLNTFIILFYFSIILYPEYINVIDLKNTFLSLNSLVYYFSILLFLLLTSFMGVFLAFKKYILKK